MPSAQRPTPNAPAQTLSRRYEDLIGEVRGLEGTLADYNLAQDKARAGVDPVEIAAFGASLRRRNADESRAIDRIFLDRQDIERGVERLEAQTQEVRAAERARLDTLPAGQRAEFAALLERNEASSKKVDAARVSPPPAPVAPHARTSRQHPRAPASPRASHARDRRCVASIRNARPLALSAHPAPLTPHPNLVSPPAPRPRRRSLPSSTRESLSTRLPCRRTCTARSAHSWSASWS